MATVIEPNGTMRDVAPAKPPHFTLEELQTLVGGYIELVYLYNGTGKVLVVNEEGKLQGLPRNETASYVAREWLMHGDFISGVAVLVSPHEMEE